MSKLIMTPYGPKTPELLTRAMDAFEREPQLLAALERAREVLVMAGCGREADKVRAAIEAATKK